ncbi:MAG: chromosomal replication initiator protein DnaA [Actinomycetota bacterium]|nr:chromosomal replication initiator protein DnaA [Actinomycetota bacterium]MDQ3679961.1 chromosomal replication initiator protein DnaA [Actinomycetota bacterium]
MRDAEQLWAQTMELLRSQIPESAWQAWFQEVRASVGEDGCLRLTVPSALARQRIEERYLKLIREVVAARVGLPVPVVVDVAIGPVPENPDQLVVSGNGSQPAKELVVSQLAQEAAHGVPASPASPATDVAPTAEGTARSAQPARTGVNQEAPLNPNYTFEAFVIGASNRFAHAAARSVAETPSRSYNPLFVHGDSGLGKTHLLHAIGNYVLEHFRGRRVRYVQTETFLNDFVEAIRTNTGSAFKRHYRQCDVLLVDDIQFMEGKEGLQEEFFHTFCSLYGASRQIVITSDRPPKAIATLEDRLRSRFLSGLTTDIQPPELETRLAILRQKARAQPVEVPDDVLALIATHVTDNIRELEGALIRITAFASLSGEALTPQLSERVLADLLAARQPRQITPGAILQSTSELFGFSVEDLCSHSRRRPLVIARQVSMYVFREVTDFSYPAIAKEFGGRDHTTVIHAVEKIANLMTQQRSVYDQVTELIHRVRSGS